MLYITRRNCILLISYSRPRAFPSVVTICRAPWSVRSIISPVLSILYSMHPFVPSTVKGEGYIWYRCPLMTPPLFDGRVGLPVSTWCQSLVDRLPVGHRRRASSPYFHRCRRHATPPRLRDINTNTRIDDEKLPFCQQSVHLDVVWQSIESDCSMHCSWRERQITSRPIRCTAYRIGLNNLNKLLPQSLFKSRKEQFYHKVNDKYENLIREKNLGNTALHSYRAYRLHRLTGWWPWVQFSPLTKTTENHNSLCDFEYAYNSQNKLHSVIVLGPGIAYILDCNQLIMKRHK